MPLSIPHPVPLLASLLLVCLAASPPAHAGEWSVEDYVRAESTDDWAVAPDGSAAAWVRSTVEKVEGEAKRVGNLWLTPLGTETGGDGPEEDEGGATSSFPLTRGHDQVGDPTFSPDGRHVAFLTDRKVPGGGEDLGKRQVWAIPLAGGEAFPVTAFDRPVLAFGWIDGDTLVAAAAESPSAWEREREEADDTTLVVEDAEREPPVRLFRVEMGDGGGPGKVERLTRNVDWIDALAVAPDGRRAVVSAQQSLSFRFDARTGPHTFLVDLPSGAMERILVPGEGERPFYPFAVRWAPDSSGFYFVDAWSSHPLYRTASVQRLWFHDLASGRTVPVVDDWGAGLGRGGYAPFAGGVVVLLAEGVRYRPMRYDRDGLEWRGRRLAGTHAANLDEVAVTPDGATLVYRHSTATVPPQWYAARLDGERLVSERQLTRLNPSWDDKPTGRAEIVTWAGALDEEVEGILFYPLDWQGETAAEPGESEPRRRRPLILDIHGGPAGTDRDTWDVPSSLPSMLWRQRGAFVLQVNYHGSAGYGLEWVESIRERYYELEIPDLESGVDHAIERGLVDPERLGVAGWSNGGILGADLITRTTRYKAASIGAADVEWISDWGNVDFGASFDNYYFGGPPWEIPEVYVEKSPFFRLTEVETPTIVYTGTEDTNVPPHQSWSLFRALQQIGKAPVRLVLFPGEAHGLRKPAHRRRKLEEDLAWFDRHLFERREPELEAVRESSPLGALLARREAVRSAGLLGVMEDGALVPETVPAPGGPLAEAGAEVGRFEVTRAQWAAFSPLSGVREGTSDYPATGMTLEQAKDYVAWLSSETGESWRLPSVEEAEALAAADGTPGNVLDWWAGYPPNPEDREEILAALVGAGVSGTAPPPRLPEEAVPGDAVAPARPATPPVMGIDAEREAPLLMEVGSFPGAGDPPAFDLDGNVAEWALGEDGEGVPVGPSADRAADPRATEPPLPEYVGLRVVRER